MNTANKITITRILLVPVFMVLLMNNMPLWALIVFCVASASDWLDGYIARKYNQITSFGKIFDPLADKFLVISALLGFVEMGQIPAWIPLIIIVRELMVMGLRVLSIEANVIVPATMVGKVKTVLQMIAIILLLIDPLYTISIFSLNLSTICIYVATAFTVYAGVEYVRACKGLIKLK